MQRDYVNPSRRYEGNPAYGALFSYCHLAELVLTEQSFKVNSVSEEKFLKEKISEGKTLSDYLPLLTIGRTSRLARCSQCNLYAHYPFNNNDTFLLWSQL